MKRGGMAKGIVTGMLIGGTAATMFGVMNWQTQRHWNQQLRKGGKRLTHMTDELMKKF